MRSLALLSLVAVASSAMMPAASAKIYPYDFAPAMDVYMNMEESEDVMPMPILAPLLDGADIDPTFFEEFAVSDVPEQGTLTRAQFAEAIATRLYGANGHVTCFEELAGTINFDHLFKDVPVDASYASSVCLMMHNGLMRGGSDMLFRPNQTITAAEAATVFSRIALIPRDERRNEAWYERYMEAMRSIDPEFTLRPWESFRAENLRHVMCIYGDFLQQMDPRMEFVGEC